MVRPSAGRWNDSPSRELEVSAKHAQGSLAALRCSGEKEMGEKLSAMLQAPHENLVGKTRLTELIAKLRACTFCSPTTPAPCTSPPRLALPTVSIFGSTCPIATGPLGDRHIVIQHKVPCSPLLRAPVPLRPLRLHDQGHARRSGRRRAENGGREQLRSRSSPSDRSHRPMIRRISFFCCLRRFPFSPLTSPTSFSSSATTSRRVIWAATGRSSSRRRISTAWRRKARATRRATAARVCARRHARC
jgi:hypothetical protein